MARTDIATAIDAADAQTAYVRARGFCRCCRVSRRVQLIATTLCPEGVWMDDEGISHAGPVRRKEPRA